MKTAEEIWDEYSQHIDSDLDSLQAIAGTCVVLKKDFLRAINKYASQSKWISVETELPYKDGDSSIYCLVNDKSNGIVVRPYNEYHKCWDGEDADDFYTKAVGGNITHWQPLPKPPSLTD